MSDIKFDIYESPANDGEKKKYHVRNTNKQTIHSKDLIHEATLYKPGTFCKRTIQGAYGGLVAYRSGRAAE